MKNPGLSTLHFTTLRRKAFGSPIFHLLVAIWMLQPQASCPHTVTFIFRKQGKGKVEKSFSRVCLFCFALEENLFLNPPDFFLCSIIRNVFIAHSFLKAHHIPSIFILMWCRLWRDGKRCIMREHPKRNDSSGDNRTDSLYCWGLNAVLWIRCTSLEWALERLPPPHFITSFLPVSPSGFFPHLSAPEEKWKSKSFLTFPKQRHHLSLPPQPGFWSSTALVSTNHLEFPDLSRKFLTSDWRIHFYSQSMDVGYK